MKTISVILLILFMHFRTDAQIPENYDSLLAKKLNADAYGMKNYFFVILKIGSENIPDKKTRDSLFAGHMLTMQKLAMQNKLVIDGPFGKNANNYEGFLLLNTEDLAEAQALLDTDPAIHAKLLSTELYLWYGSAAIQELPAIHDKIARYHF